MYTSLFKAVSLLMAAFMWAGSAQAQQSQPVGKQSGGVSPNIVCQAECGGDGPPGGSYTLSPLPPEKLAVSPGGVNMRSGYYQYDHLDLSIAGDHAMELRRSAADPQVNGHQSFGGFTSNWDIYVTESRVKVPEANKPGEYAYQVSISYAGKSSSFYSEYGFVGGFVENSGDEHSTLTFDGEGEGVEHPSVYEFTAYDGTKVTFQPVHGDCSSGCGYATQITEPDGTHYSLSYDSAGLRSVVSNRGSALLFEYNVSGYPHLVSKACVLNLGQNTLPDTLSANICPAGVPISTYNYTSGLLSSFVDQGGISTLIGPHASLLYNAGETTPYLTNTFLGGSDATYYVVGAQSFVDGRSYAYEWYRVFPDSAGVGGGYAGGTYTNNNGKSVQVRYSGMYTVLSVYPAEQAQKISPTPWTISDENGNVITTDFSDCPYGEGAGCGFGPPHIITYPEGNSKELAYDSYRNVTQTVMHAKAGSGLANVTTSATFDCTYAVSCVKPVTATDALGKVTSYTYDPVHGGVLSEVDPAVLVNGSGSAVAPAKRYQYAQRYAWISDGSGGFVHAASPVWVLTGMKTCRSTATSTPVSYASTCAGGSADEVTTTYDYGPDTGLVGNNLQQRGEAVTADGVTRRSCYGYDGRGNKIWETKPDAGLAACY